MKNTMPEMTGRPIRKLLFELGNFSNIGVAGTELHLGFHRNQEETMLDPKPWSKLQWGSTPRVPCSSKWPMTGQQSSKLWLPFFPLFFHQFSLPWFHAPNLPETEKQQTWWLTISEIVEVSKNRCSPPFQTVQELVFTRCFRNIFLLC